ncbi:preprotein translocase subunit SecD [Sphingomonas sp. Leaf33]|uniref:protein translocase subunit SecD n=1 Tax=Sphingomonas sp. Leaf33 TaxID=1736215 RepID=UPI0006F380FC|nr:protein translocase subunit SecD [Sphingomonas sp. Leaf33]KQN26693.1 preprotein translocase subunit SecD [Sphingomonas sp. Leaf33]
MLDFPKWKVWLVWATIAFCTLLAIPSLVPEDARAKWPGWIPQPVINLGLDLAGGSYILLEADTKDVAAARIEAMREQIQTDMRRATPRINIGDISTRDGQLSFVVRDSSQVDAVRERLLPMTTGAGMTGQRDWDISVVDTNRFVMKPTAAGINQAIDTAMNDAREIVGKRINALGTREPNIVREGANRIVVEVPGLSNPEELKALIGKTAKLEFKLVDLAADSQAIQRGQAPIGSQILPYANGGGTIAVKRSTVISGDQIADAKQTYDENGQPDVTLTFNGEGGRRFARVTQENVGKPFAIIVDNQVISAPNINTAILGGVATISGGGFTTQTANELAIALRSGKLPVDLKVVQESSISAELGQDSIDKGVLAGIVGSVALILFMIATYLRFGVYTTAALLVNAVMILGLMALFNATLTLPGIAGFVLTIGAAVDANVLINERIREEQRIRGRAALPAVEVGYKEASRAIFDANLTNVISAVIMFVFGSGPIRGFAVVLAIGIVTSVFTGVTFTRLLVAGWLKRNRPKSINI